MMRVDIWKTTIDGTYKVGAVTWDNRKLLSTNERLLYLLFGTKEPSTNSIASKMRNAPLRFDGSYVRATFEESA